MHIPYTIDDGNGGTDTGTLAVRIFDAPPAAEDDTNQTSINTDISGNVLLNDSDPNPADSISVSGINGSGLLSGDVFAAGTTTVVGSVIIDSTGNYTFMPNATFVGEAEFTYTIIDGSGNTDNATVSIEVRDTDGPDGPGPEQFNNTAPIATDDNFGLLSGFVGYMSNLFGNDSDPDGDTISVSSTLTGNAVNVSGTVVGTYAITNASTGDFTFTPNASFIGEAFFDYTISDPSGATDSATVTLDINPDTNGPANNAPIAGNDTVTGGKNSPVSGSLLSNDTDPNPGETADLTVVDINGTAISATGITAVNLLDGTLAYDANTNTFEFTPTTADFTGTIQVPYTISDNVTGDPLSDTGVLTISYFDNPPVAKDDFNVTDDGVAVSGNVLPNDSDPNPMDGITVIATVVTPLSGNAVDSTGTAVGTYTIAANGSYTFSPTAGFVGCLLYTSPSPRDLSTSRMPSSA